MCRGDVPAEWVLDVFQETICILPLSAWDWYWAHWMESFEWTAWFLRLFACFINSKCQWNRTAGSINPQPGQIKAGSVEGSLQSIATCSWTPALLLISLCVLDILCAHWQNIQVIDHNTDSDVFHNVAAAEEAVQPKYNYLPQLGCHITKDVYSHSRTSLLP